MISKLRSPLTFILALASLLPSLSAQAQVASLATPITPDDLLASGAPSGFVRLGSRLLFAARRDDDSSFSLWATDGTPIGTEKLVEDFCSGFCDSFEDRPTLGIQVLGHLAYWRAPIPFGDCSPTSTPGRLWRSDGTPEGTFPLTGCDLSAGETVGPVGGKAVFRGYSDFYGDELWVTDGTVEGTAILIDLEPGPAGLHALSMSVLDDRLYFLVHRFPGGLQLWTSDGTTSGTRIAVGIGEQVTSSSPSPLVRVGSRLLFHADTPNGRELWSSDGTPDGTATISSFVNELPFQSTHFFKVVGGRAYFVAEEMGQGEEVWVSDGTPAGTRRVTSLPLANPFNFQFGPGRLAEAGGHLFLLFEHVFFEDPPSALWVAGSTPSSTHKVLDLCEGRTCSLDDATSFGNRIYFPNYTPDLGFEVWSSDGSATGTGPVADLCRGACGNVGPISLVAGELFFQALDSAGQTSVWRATAGGALDRFGILGTTSFFDGPRFLPIAGRLGSATIFPARTPAGDVELWRRHGVQDDIVADLARGPAHAELGPFSAAGASVVLFGKEERFGPSTLWALTSPAGPASQLLDSLELPCADPARPCQFGNGQVTFFQEQDFGFSESALWRTDGTPLGTLELLPSAAQPGVEPFQLLGVLAGSLVFVGEPPAGTSSSRPFLWMSDGTPSGTLSQGELNAFDPGFGFVSPTVIGGAIYFLYQLTSNAAEIWRTDGTLAGTERLASVDLGFGDPKPTFSVAGSDVLFFAPSPSFGLRLHRLPGGNGPAETLRAFPCSHSPRDLPLRTATFQDEVYFFTCESFDEAALWKSDGTAAGTVEVASFPGWRIPFEGPDPQLVAATGGVFFTAALPDTGIELWFTDGSAEGTQMVREIRPGALTSHPFLLAAAGNRVIFRADDGIHGAELWVSDGTEAGTRLLHDINPGPGSSLPTGGDLAAQVIGDRLWFPANDGLHGTEPWSLPLALDGPACADTPRGLCLQDDRFRAEIFWRDFQGGTGFGQPTSLTSDTGTFWFFDPTNVEVITKVLDARALNGHFWTFFGALTSVQYDLTLTDTETGLTRRYSNYARTLASGADTSAFGPRGSALGSFTEVGADVLGQGRPEVSVGFEPRAASGSCAPSGSQLCLNQGRFAVEATWRDFQGNVGVGMAQSLTADTGTFWFFDPANLEVVLKVLDGTALNGKYWVFYGALSSVEYTLTVTDTLTGAMKVYRNPSGTLASEADTAAFGPSL